MGNASIVRKRCRVGKHFVEYGGKDEEISKTITRKKEKKWMTTNAKVLENFLSYAAAGGVVWDPK